MSHFYCYIVVKNVVMNNVMILVWRNYDSAVVYVVWPQYSAKGARENTRKNNDVIDDVIDDVVDNVIDVIDDAPDVALECSW